MNNFLMKTIFSFLLLFTVSFINAQDVTGIWRGHFRSGNISERMSSLDDRYKFEVQIAQHNKTLEAITYSYLSSVFYGKATADGSVNQGSQKILLREIKIVELRSIGGVGCNMTCFMKYSKIGDEEFLEGTYTSVNAADSSNCGKGTVFLRKVVESDFYKEPFLVKRENEIAKEKKKIASINKTNPIAKPKNNDVKKPADNNNVAKNNTNKKPVNKTTEKPAIAKLNTDKHSIEPIKTDTASFKIHEKIAPSVIVPDVIANRKNELIKTITVNTNEVELNIYDDGAIDHDTVSVYLDKKLVVAHRMLTDQAIVVKLHLDDDNNYHEIVMVADNEGEIPPNTSLMVVKAGDKRYEVRIVSTEQKNATVIFKYEKK